MKYRIITLVFIFFLAGCSLITEDQLSLTLNPGIDTVEINTIFSDAGAKARVGIQKIDTEVIKNEVDLSQIGSYHIVYEAKYNDKSYYITRIVNVIDETPPVISLNPGIDTIKINKEWIDAGVTVYDNSLKNCQAKTLGIVDTTTEGEYEIIYIATDPSGNETRISRFVSVIN